MKNKLFFLFISVLFINNTQAQQVVVLHSPTNGVQYFQGTNPLQDAYAAAEVTGDTIYLPGGDNTISTPTWFEKSLVIYGAGHYPNATAVTKPSKLGIIRLRATASGTHIEGVEFTSLYLGNVSVNNITIKRCKFNNIDGGGNRNTPAENNTFIENVIGSLNNSNMMNSRFFNNIIESGIGSQYSNHFYNNLFLYSDVSGNIYPPIGYADLCSFRNNIFLMESNKISGGDGTSSWRNNIFCTNTTTPELGFEPQLIDNYFMTRADVLINQTGHIFDYTHDYHLQAAAAANLGDDGFETGIFGGFYPWKTESLPVTPHISARTIAPNSNAGTLQINISAQAQDR